MRVFDTLACWRPQYCKVCHCFIYGSGRRGGKLLTLFAQQEWLLLSGIVVASIKKDPRPEGSFFTVVLCHANVRFCIEWAFCLPHKASRFLWECLEIHFGRLQAMHLLLNHSLLFEINLIWIVHHDTCQLFSFHLFILSACPVHTVFRDDLSDGCPQQTKFA